uniref:FA complementation group D2 n=1 Tax=Pygocentrus nattereri TaxID=42514 RepID=A0AAR2ITG3_PYGNA
MNLSYQQVAGKCVNSRTLVEHDAQEKTIIVCFCGWGTSLIRCAHKAAVSDQVPDSVFVHMLQESGVILRLGNMSNEIAVDQVVFQKRLQQHLRKDSRYPSVSEFISGFETHIEDPEKLRNCLLPCVPRSAGDGDARYCLKIMVWLLLLVEVVGEDGLNIPRVIINQLKWLDRVVDFKDLANKLMQLVSVAPIEIQRDIITSLPEILEDSQHGDMARELKHKTAYIVCTPTFLSLPACLCVGQVRGAVMSTVSAVQLEDLPIVVKFILHSISASDANEVVSDLRKKLELEQCVVFSMLQASQSSGKNKKSTACSMSVSLVSFHFHLFSVIKSAVRFQKTISEAWLKAIENVTELEDHKVHILNKLIYIEFYSPSTLFLLFEFLHVMRGYFPSILALAQGLLRSPDCCVVPFGGHMYKQAFTAFDSYCQQEVVGSLVTHVCSGVSGEVDVALELLCELVSQKPTEMSQYAVFVKGILDYMENLNPQQIRRLFHLLSSLAFGHDKHGSHIQDDMHIVIRKQLSSAVPKYKRIGIIGAVMMVGSMGARRCGLQSLSKHCFFLLLVWVCACACMCSLFPFPASVMYNLDEDESQGGIAVNLLPLMSQDVLHRPDNRISASQRNGRHVSPLCLSSFFRLLRLCEEEQHHGDLEEIDALLGCPLILTDMEVVERVESLSKAEREFFCSLLFYTINWFREVVNAFCKQTDPEMKMKVVTRLQNITYLQTLLETCLAASPGYTPPLANFDCESAEVLFPISSTASAKKAKKGKGIRCIQEADHSEKEKEKEVKVGVSLSLYWPFFRELDVEVMNVLQCGLLSRSILDTELHSKVSLEVQLGPSELVFLLEDMCRKLDFSLTAAPAKKAPFLKVKADKTVGFSHLRQKSSKDVAAYCIQLLPTLCTHLENCHNHFQVYLHVNQGVVDALGVDVKEQQLMSSAYQLLLQVLHTTFSWWVLSFSTLPTSSDYITFFFFFLPASLARHFLCQEWVTVGGAKERGNKHNDALHNLLSIYLDHADDVLKAVEEIAGEGIPELMNAAKDASSRSWPTLSRQTFLVYYKVMMTKLEKSVRKLPPGKQTDSREVQSEKLLTWSLAVRDFHILINLVKVFDSRLVLNVCLKYGRLFLESFLKLGMPLLDYSFKKHKEDVQSLLKTFQLSTRQLHHMCGHSKIQQDTALTNHVPALKKSLEQFVYRVKAMLTLNQCQEAFWLGNLKNRDLKVSNGTNSAFHNVF